MNGQRRKEAHDKVVLQKKARGLLGSCPNGLQELFSRAANRIGVPFSGGKARGYEILRKFVAQFGHLPPIYSSRKQLQRKAAKSSAALPVSCFGPSVDPTSDEFLRSYAWRRLRMVVLKAYGARCQCCGATAKDGIVIHVDHIKPRRKHPELALVESNLQVLCEVCNHGKGNWDDTDWRKPEPDPSTYEPCWSNSTNRVN